MFGKNIVTKSYNKYGDNLRVVYDSPFLTIQGEGPYAGRAAVFLRLHGCNLRCSFCDTDFDSAHDPTIHIYDIVRQIMHKRGLARLVVITGGEPLLQNIVPLCKRLREIGFDVQVETAGTLWLEGLEEVADVVVSPKTPVIHEMAYNHAVAFKYVISTRNQPPEGFVPVTNTQGGSTKKILALPRSGAPVYLSPMDEYDEVQNSLNRNIVAKLAIQYNVIAGVQLHKFLGVD